MAEITRGEPVEKRFGKVTFQVTREAFAERERLEKALPELLGRRKDSWKSVVVHGKNDSVVPPEDAALTAKLLGLAREEDDGVIWTDGGHSDVRADVLLAALARAGVPVVVDA